MQVRTKWAVAVLSVAMLCSVAMAGPVPLDEEINPEAGSGYIEKHEVTSQHFMFTAANPLATEAGYQTLKRGGSAIDAAIAAQLVLGLVEPQSSGIGGGAFIVYYDPVTRSVSTYDGRETAPAAISSAPFVVDGQPVPYFTAVNSGLAVGVPGVLRALEMAHDQHGTLAWSELFEPAIALAENGFPVSPRLHIMLHKSRGLDQQEAAAMYFFDELGQPWPVGHVLKNPEYAHAMRQIAANGTDVFYEGEIARDIVSAVHQHASPGSLALSDMARYRAIQRAPLCSVYRVVYRICGMAPPSSGTLGVAQMLGILEHFPMATLKPAGVEAVHYFSEAGRLAYADRDFYVADPAFVDVPTQALISPAYLASRAALISPDRSMGVAQPGDPMAFLSSRGRDRSFDLPSTTHLSGVDAQGHVVSLTSSVESAFGSKIFVHGFLLNNQLTDFSALAVDDEGLPVANRVEPGKRPRSTMSPLIVFHHDEPYLVIGSPGGSAIMNFVAKALVGVLDWKLGIQEAISLPNFGSRNRSTELEEGTALEDLVQPLRQKGHHVRVTDFPSGLHGILLGPGALHGGADPRREGTAMGD